jgi:hypothetical protein
MQRTLLALLVVCLCAAASLVGLAATPIPQAAAAVGDPVVAAAGDIACAPPATRTATRCHQGDTAAVLGRIAQTQLDAVLPLGDEQYECGQLSAFNQVYDPTWGQFKSISYPAVGDNEYAGDGCTTPGAEGYFTYFGDRATPRQPGCTINCQGYYSYNLGSWHLVALNSECIQPGVGGCSATSPQVQWLKADLAADASTCDLAYFHRPYFSDKGGTIARTRQLFKALYDGGVDVLLVGHQHIYERFAPQNLNGQAVANGVRQFIVGTGGKSQGPLASPPPANAQARQKGTYGVLKLTLHATSYDFEFVPEAGKTYTDTGSRACH